MSKHIATAAIYGMTGTRVGTKYLFSEKEISEYLAKLERDGKPPQLRRVGEKP